MKTNNLLKPIGWVLSMGLQVLVLLSCDDANSKKVQSKEEVSLFESTRQVIPAQYEESNSFRAAYNLQPNEVSLEKALEQINYYKLWLNYLPKTFKYDIDTKKIIFSEEIPVDPSHIEILESKLLEYCAKNEDSSSITSCLDSLPFHGIKNYAYFISIQDMIEALGIEYNTVPDGIIIKESTIDLKESNGIRAYIGIENVDTDEASAIYSHLYVVPTKRGSIIDDKKNCKYGRSYYSSDIARFKKKADDPQDSIQYVYDLTAPCPAYCDTLSNVNNSGVKVSNNITYCPDNE